MITDGVSYPKDTDLGEIKNLENQLGINFPWQIDPSEKVQEILDLTGYKQFFDILVSQTPCGICMTTKSDHNETTGHEYKPFQIYDANNTFCLVCNKPMKNHGSDHQFKPKFIPYHFKELKQPFVNI